jgi:hypothetical protein
LAVAEQPKEPTDFEERLAQLKRRERDVAKKPVDLTLPSDSKGAVENDLSSLGRQLGATPQPYPAPLPPQAIFSNSNIRSSSDQYKEKDGMGKNTTSLVGTIKEILSKEDRFKLSDLVVLITFDCVGLPLCIAGAETAVHFDWVPTLVGFGIGIPLSIFGTIFPFIGAGPMKTAIRNWMGRHASVVVPLAIVAAFIYVAGPEIYQRAMQSPPVSSKGSGFTQQQVDEKISNAVANLNSQLTESNRQRDVARREAEAFRQQIQNAPAPSRELDAPRVFTKLTPDQIRAIYENRTPLQGDILFADEAGKWLAFEGKVDNVTNGWLILLDNNNKNVQCAFDNTWRAKLSVLRPKDVVKVVGKLQPSQSQNVVLLQSCEFGG